MCPSDRSVSRPPCVCYLLQTWCDQTNLVQSSRSPLHRHFQKYTLTEDACYVKVHHLLCVYVCVCVPVCARVGVSELVLGRSRIHFQKTK